MNPNYFVTKRRVVKSPHSAISQDLELEPSIREPNASAKKRDQFKRGLHHQSMCSFKELRDAKKKQKDLANLNSVITRSVSRINEIVQTSSLVDLMQGGRGEVIRRRASNSRDASHSRDGGRARC